MCMNYLAKQGALNFNYRKVQFIKIFRTLLSLVLIDHLYWPPYIYIYDMTCLMTNESYISTFNTKAFKFIVWQPVAYLSECNHGELIIYHLSIIHTIEKATRDKYRSFEKYLFHTWMVRYSLLILIIFRKHFNDTWSIYHDLTRALEWHEGLFHRGTLYMDKYLIIYQENRRVFIKYF